MNKVFLMLVFIILFFSFAYCCTTILVTKGASTDGSVFVSHSDDDELGDQRLVYVPAMDHPEGSKRPVVYERCSLGHNPKYENSIQRYVGEARGPSYINNDLPQSVPIGYIEQVTHTYAYFDANYGVMNEHQLMIGECTDGAKVEPQPSSERLFYSAELSRVALERCTNARDAIELMGELIDEYGYYGTGETLLVADTEEGWVFEMCGYDENSSDGLWVAKKVPDGEVFVASNMFRIREVDPDDPDMIYSDNLFEVAKNKGWWDPEDGPLDWLSTVSNGEYNHPYYSLRRQWSIFNRLSPSSNFSPWVENSFTYEYPFSIKPDNKLTVQDVFALHRDHYENTEFDMTKGIAAGPFGTPNRYIGEYDGNQNNVNDTNNEMVGAWERPVSVIYCGYVYVNQARGFLPDPIGGVCWFGPDKPSETCFVPFYVGMSELPKSYSTGTTEKFNSEVAWWVFNFVANWADLKYSYMTKDIQKLQKDLEDKEVIMQAAIETAALELYKIDETLAKEYLTRYSIDNTNYVLDKWRELAVILIEKYDDGYLNDENGMAQEIGYPQWWLDEVGYSDGPTSYEKK